MFHPDCFVQRGLCPYVPIYYNLQLQLVQEKSEDVKLSGSNPSAEEEAEQMDAAVQSGINVILSARMNEFGLDKKGYTQHIKEYMKA